MSIEIRRLSANDDLLDDVIRLWRAHSATLGYFPEGAFEDYAQKEQILVATNSTESLVGYLAYRRTRERAAIIHLCISPEHRGTGAARLLVERLCEEVRSCAGISLRCRRDFEASKVWPRLKFEARNELPGRGRDGGTLTVWCRDLGNPDLFRRAAQLQPSTKIRAAVDANVFFDFTDENPQGTESRALLADWLSDDVELHVTPELSNEVDRAKDPALRLKHRASLTEFARCEETSQGAYDRALGKIHRLLPSPQDDSDESDRRQLAWAVSAGVEYFLTRDGDLLDASEALFTELKISVLRPSQFVRQLDELVREDAYAPVRLAGTGLRLRLMAKSDEEIFAASLHFGHGGEGRGEFLGRVRNLSCDPTRFDVRGVFNGEGRAHAVFALNHSEGDSLQIPLLRVAKGAAMLTLARHLLYKAQCRAIEIGRDVTELVDPLPSPEVVTALLEEDWLKGPDGVWRKWNLKFIGNSGALFMRLRSSRSFAPDYAVPIVKEVERLLAVRDVVEMSVAAARVERLLWPAKILGAGLPTFMVPIKPAWAQQLFDERLATQTLFGARNDLALNRQAIYYRSARPQILTAPGRVLWYVSDDDATIESMAIRACSSLDEMVVGHGKELFARFRRFGVYEWRDIKNLMDKSKDQKLMAFRFSSTEQFPSPIAVQLMRCIFGRHKKGLMTAGPSQIDEALFEELYRSGGLA